MKKISLLLFGALFALGARAQVYTNGEWRIDSTVTTKLDGQFLLKDVYHYDDNGLLVEILGQEATDGTIYNTKSIYTYNDQGMTKTQTLYRQVGSDFSLLSEAVVTEYYEDSGLPKVVESTGPGSELMGDMKTKTVITKYHGTQFEEEEVYLWLGTDWTKNATSTATFNSADLMTKMVTVMGYMGYEMTTEVDYEYDSHGNTTKETTTSMGSTSVVTYANEYDANDNLIKVTTDNGGDVKVTKYYWSRGGASGISSAVKNVDGSAHWYDLSGHRLVGKPTKQGVYIRDGKKFVIK